MTMHTVFLKEHQGSIGQDSVNGALAAAPRWGELGSQPTAVAYNESSFVQSKRASLEFSAGAKQAEGHQGLAGKGNCTHLSLFSGECKAAENGEKTPMQTVSADYGGHYELGFGQPLICGKHPYAEQVYGLNSTYGTQIPGRIMLPLSMETDGGPIFVNAKQYNGIMRRRKKRAEAELENKVLRFRKPYLHLSRHLHAIRRPRGNGGRFLNTKNLNGSTDKTSPKNDAVKKRPPQAAGSQTSEVLQSDGRIYSKGTNGSRSTSPTSEVTSHHLFSQDATTTHHPFQINRQIHPSFQPFPDVADTVLGIAVASGNYL